MAGILYGIGVGPGDPELLTLKAKRILEQVDILLVPKSRIEKRSLALSIVSGAIDRTWEQVDLHMPMSTDKQLLEKHWQQAAEQIVDILVSGKDAAFITLGDPSLYSTFTYVLKYVRQMEPDTRVEIVPGISSVHSIAAWVQVPLAEAEESLAIVPALKDQQSLQAIFENYENIVLMKAGNQIDKVIEIMEQEAKAGRPKKVVYASRCGFEDGFYTDDLEQLKDKKLDYLSTMIIKKDGTT